MSWGERSCTKEKYTSELCTMGNCNVYCKGYIWDGKTIPDSGPESEVKINKQEFPIKMKKGLKQKANKIPFSWRKKIKK